MSYSFHVGKCGEGKNAIRSVYSHYTMPGRFCQPMFQLGFKFGFIGALKIEIVGADVLDGPMPTREDSLSGKGYLRGVEDVAPYIWVT